MMRWVRMAGFGLAAFGAVTFLVDWGVYKFSGSPRSKYTVSHFVSAPLNGKGQEIDYTGSEVVPCSLSMYPQDGFTPCWYLKRHTNQVSSY